MGISGLLPALKDITVNGNIADFKGKTLAVDAYVWLHKGAFGCAEDIVKGKKTTRFVDYAMHRVRMLRHFGITPYIVFDGGPLPAKKGTEVSRAASRAEYLERARAYEGQGRGKEARDCYTKCLDITPEMAYQLIKALRAENVQYVVAPYEADAQLCFLEREGFVDGIITEDSDLLVFGCRKVGQYFSDSRVSEARADSLEPKVIFKMDGNGDCGWIDRADLAKIRDFSMEGWTDTQFRRMAMLSGCDYLDSIPGIGLKTAHRLLRRFKTVEKALQSIRLEGALAIPPNYIRDFAQAELAFLHQRVFDPETKRMTPLNDFPEGGLKEQDEKWIGLDLSQDIAIGISQGDLHPETHERIEDLWPDYQPVARGSLVSKTVLGESTRTNSGPLDAFFTRSKRPRVKAILPTPVGVIGSGPTRLSDLAKEQTTNENEVSPVALQPRTSKFFAEKPCRRLAETKTEVLELTWEESETTDDSLMLDDGMETEPGTSSARFSSLSDMIQSPPQFASSCPDLGEDPQLSSPPRTGVSSPAFSTPSNVSISPQRGTTFSPEPSSPSKAPTQAMDVLVPQSSVLDLETQTPTRKDSRPFSRLTSVLVPGTSPFITARTEAKGTVRRDYTSSDSVSEEEVVTPSIEAVGKRKLEVEDEEDDSRREEKAKAISRGWRAKYQFKSNGFMSPMPSMRKTQPKNVHKTVERPKVLSARAANIPVVVETPKARMEEKVAKKTRDTERPSSSSSLEKFRFKGKVKLDPKERL
ncbi:exonuclease 1, partial [Tremellales sp. Uapishka_1]